MEKQENKFDHSRIKKCEEHFFSRVNVANRNAVISENPLAGLIEITFRTEYLVTLTSLF
jgi:hypothetical protein